MNWRLILWHALSAALIEGARQSRMIAENMHEKGALPETEKA